MRKAALLVAMLFLAGCASAISDESLKMVDPSLSLRTVQTQPDDFRGKNLLVGGLIVKIRNSDAGAEIEVVEFPLKSNYLPDINAMSGGRFLAISGSFADPAVFRPGTLVSMVGEVKGEKKQQLDEATYRYPVVAIKEMHAWRPGEIPSEPQFHFGFGLGFGHRF